MFYSKIKGVTTHLLMLGVLLALFLSGSFVNAQNEQGTQANKDFQQKQGEVQNQIISISDQVNQIISGYEDSTSQSKTLAGQVSNKQSNIQKTDALILDTTLVIGQIEKQIADNEKQIASLNNQIRPLLLEIQQRQTTNPLKIILSSKNFGSAISEIYSLSSVESQITQKREEVETLNKNLETTKQQNEEVKQELEKSRALLRSEQANLDFLLAETQGQESKYKQLLDTISQQKTELEAQLGVIKGEYIAELQGLREEETRRNILNSGCEFEETETLQVPPDYFGKPAIGALTQGFHCGHDGIDVAANMGSPIMTVADGEVVRIGPSVNGCIGIRCNGGFGNFLVIKHTLPSNQVVYSLYSHLQRPTTKLLGQKVTKGEQVGQMGCTGFTKPYPCGVHIHFVMLSQSYETQGLGCRLGSASCYNPSKYIKY
jgi:murein DD-endopeptidase MepM/ murein hydrolase activator NlpD